MKVMMIGKATKDTEAGVMPTEAAMLAMHQFTEELGKAGVLVDLAGLTPTSRGVRVRYHKSKTTVVDGPFAEAKELIAGYFIIQVKTMAEAVEWAKRAPFEEGAECELRPLFSPEDFDVPGEAEERAKKQKG